MTIQAATPILAWAATPVTLPPLTLAHHRFVLALMAHRPRLLALEPSPESLAERACNVDGLMLAMRDYLLAIVEDCAANMHLPRDLAGTITAHMDDMAGDVRGALNVAVEEAANG